MLFLRGLNALLSEKEVQGYRRFGTDSTATRKDGKTLIIIHPRGKLDDPNTPMYWAEVPSESKGYCEGHSIEEILKAARFQFGPNSPKDSDATIAFEGWHVELAF